MNYITCYNIRCSSCEYQTKKLKCWKDVSGDTLGIDVTFSPKLNVEIYLKVNVNLHSVLSPGMTSIANLFVKICRAGCLFSYDLKTEVEVEIWMLFFQFC